MNRLNTVVDSARSPFPGRDTGAVGKCKALFLAEPALTELMGCMAALAVDEEKKSRRLLSTSSSRLLGCFDSASSGRRSYKRNLQASEALDFSAWPSTRGSGGLHPFNLWSAVGDLWFNIEFDVAQRARG
jgi:hypothetical protein